MNSSRPWSNEVEFLDLFEIDTNQEGAGDFLTLCTLTSFFVRFPELGKSFYDVVSARLRELKWSPMVFYARIRRAIRPVFEAGIETLAGLGVNIEGEAVTVPALVKAIAAVLAEDIPEAGREAAMEAARYVEKSPKEPRARG